MHKTKYAVVVTWDDSQVEEIQGSGLSLKAASNEACYLTGNGNALEAIALNAWIVEDRFAVQETIGGWRQVPCFEGTWVECRAYLRSSNKNNNYAIHHQDEVEIDWL